jgi:hypothetical protein
MKIDRWIPRDKLELETGLIEQVLGKTPDGAALRILYVDAPLEQEKLGVFDKNIIMFRLLLPGVAGCRRGWR